jgi:hypothetical protein
MDQHLVAVVRGQRLGEAAVEVGFPTKATTARTAIAQYFLRGVVFMVSLLQSERNDRPHVARRG